MALLPPQHVHTRQQRPGWRRRACTGAAPRVLQRLAQSCSALVAQGALAPKNDHLHAQAGAGASGCADPTAQGPAEGAVPASTLGGEVRSVGLRLHRALRLPGTSASRLCAQSVRSRLAAKTA